MCKKCETNPVYEFTNKRKLCARCFVNYFQKKVLYTIRKFGMIKNGDVVAYKIPQDFRDVVLEDVLKMFSEKANVELVKNSNKKRFTKFALSDTIDLKSNELVNKLIKENVNLNDFEPVSKKIIKPLYLFLDEEVLLYAKLRKLKFKKDKEAKSVIEKFLNETEKKHPEVKRAIINSYLKLRN